ncbi:endonuclease MutS2 [Paucilactobacillus sp. N302-9]
MNTKILETLEYQRIIDQLNQYTVSAAGKREVNKMQPSSDRELVQEMIIQTSDAADILRIAGGIPLPKLADISVPLKRLDIDATLSGSELALVSKVLLTTAAVRHFFADLADRNIELQVLPQLVQKLMTLDDVTKRLKNSIEGDGRLKDEASTKLHGIRQQISKLEVQIRQQMEDYTRGKNAKYLSDTIVTMRNDRYVIPVLANYRAKFGGVVHDESQSGQTLFIEPQAVMDLNNRLRQYQGEQKVEELRILQELSALIAPYRTEIANNEKILGQLDFVNAKAHLAKQMNASLPLVSNQNHVDLRQARHPLLDQQKVVANDIKIGDDYKAIIITGPNTGGKTITLKTLGLIQLMGQSGLFITTNENSYIGVYDEIFADIGDEQSLEQSLSTFSAHMKNTINILHSINERSLVLLDEVGAGTDPKEGAALAISILDAIGQKDTTVLATTHYPELKVYGYDRPQTINASMEFDTQTLRPTYRLLMGIPGRSNAFEIAQRLGLDEAIIMQAQNLVSSDSQDLNDMIGDLVAQRKAASDETRELKQQLSETTELHEELTQKFTQFEQQKESMLAKASQEANHQVADAKKKADQIISQLRKLERQGAHIKENQLISAQGDLNALHVDDPRLKKNKVLQREKRKHDFHVGDAVLVKSYGQYGELAAQMGKGQWEVQLGILKMKVAENDLEKVSKSQLADNTPKPAKKATVHASGTQHASARLDLRGHRYDQAMQELDQFIDQAVLSNIGAVSIIHGKGTGALRKGTQEYLQSNPRVKSFEFANANAGGDGATIAYLQ